jgi:hypothetical protein
MRILIFILFIPTAFPFDQSLLQKEKELLRKEFLIKQDKSDLSLVTNSSNKLIRKRDDSGIVDLESMYFDTVKTKAAAPEKIFKKKTRSR